MTYSQQGGGGGVAGISSDRDDQMEPKFKAQKNPRLPAKPQKCLDQKLTPKNIPCRFCGPYKFQVTSEINRKFTGAKGNSCDGKAK